MSRRKPNVAPRVRPSEAKRTGLPPRMNARAGEDPVPDFLTDLPPPEQNGSAVTQAAASEGRPEEEDVAEDSPLLGDVLDPSLFSNDPALAGGAGLSRTGIVHVEMSDEPFPGQTPDDSDRMLDTHIHQAYSAPPPANEPLPVQAPAPAPKPAPKAKKTTVPKTGNTTKYIQRITVADAYQFDGRVQTAPAWVDRNWLGFSDEAKDILGTGIVLEVPRVGTVRVGDYVVKQEVLLDEHGTSVPRMAVYDRDEFERLFLRVAP